MPFRPRAHLWTTQMCENRPPQLGVTGNVFREKRKRRNSYWKEPRWGAGEVGRGGREGGERTEANCAMGEQTYSISGDEALRPHSCASAASPAPSAMRCIRPLPNQLRVGVPRSFFFAPLSLFLCSLPATNGRSR